MVRAFTSAPKQINLSATSTLFHLAALCSGVQPSSVLALTDAPESQIQSHWSHIDDGQRLWNLNIFKDLEKKKLWVAVLSSFLFLSNLQLTVSL